MRVGMVVIVEIMKYKENDDNSRNVRDFGFPLLGIQQF